VQVREEHLAGPQQRALGQLRLLDLDDEVAGGKDRGGVRHDLRACRAVVLVAAAHALPGSGLHHHGVAAERELAHRRRHQADPVLVDLDLCGDADAHAELPGNVFVAHHYAAAPWQPIAIWRARWRRYGRFCTTGESDCLLRAVARRASDFERLHSKVLTKLPGVARVDSSFALRPVVKQGGLPLN
jgi:Lrp/AsnC ligand binding domain